MESGLKASAKISVPPQGILAHPELMEAARQQSLAEQQLAQRKLKELFGAAQSRSEL